MDERPADCWPTEPGVREGYARGVVEEMGRVQEGDIGGQGLRGVAAAVITCTSAAVWIIAGARPCLEADLPSCLMCCAKADGRFDVES